MGGTRRESKGWIRGSRVLCGCRDDYRLHSTRRESISETWGDNAVRFDDSRRLERGSARQAECTRQDSNLQPSVPKTDALSIELRVPLRPDFL